MNRSNFHKRATSQGYSKQRQQQNKTPNGSSSISFDLTNAKLQNDKLNLSSIVNAHNYPSTTLEYNSTSSFNQATLSSAAKAKSRNYSETVNCDISYIKPVSGLTTGMLDIQKCLFPVQEAGKIGDSAEIENALWDSPHSFLDNNGEGSDPNQEQVNQESISQNSTSKIRSEFGIKKSDSSGIEKQGTNDFGTIKRLKEMIHKLQLKDAIQRQEIQKLKRINEKIKNDSKTFEEKAHSLERIKIQEYHSLKTQGYGPKTNNKSKADINESFQHNISNIYEDNPNLQDITLTQQIEQITYEKIRLEETLKNLLLDRELSKANMDENIHQMEVSKGRETPKKNLNLSNLIVTPNNEGNYKPFSLTQTPQEASKRSSSAGRSSSRLANESMTTPKRYSQQKSNEVSTEKKYQVPVKKIGNLSSRDNSPMGKIGPQTCTANKGRMSPIDLIFGVNSASKNSQTPRLNTNRNSPSREKLSARKEFNTSPAPEKKGRKDYQSVGKNPLSIDCNPRRGAEVKNSALNDSSVTPVKALPLFRGNQAKGTKEKVVVHQEKSILDESKNSTGASDNQANNSSYLNNVSPAVIDIILQHQKTHQVKANTRNNSISNYHSVESSMPSSLNDTYPAKLNLEYLFASNGREKENRKEKKNENISAPSIPTVNTLCQALTHVKIDPQTIPKQIQGYKKNESSEDKVFKKNPLDEISSAQKLMNSMQSDMPVQSQSQNYITTNLQEIMNQSDISVTPVILSAQPQGRQISSKRAQQALETLRAKMQKRET